MLQIFPDQDALEALASERGGKQPAPQALHDLLAGEVARLNTARIDYRDFERITHIRVVLQPLSPEDGTLTRTLKPKRPAIEAEYAADVQQLMKQLRG